MRCDTCKLYREDLCDPYNYWDSDSIIPEEINWHEVHEWIELQCEECEEYVTDVK